MAGLMPGAIDARAAYAGKKGVREQVEKAQTVEHHGLTAWPAVITHCGLAVALSMTTVVASAGYQAVRGSVFPMSPPTLLLA